MALVLVSAVLVQRPGAQAAPNRSTPPSDPARTAALAFPHQREVVLLDAETRATLLRVPTRHVPRALALAASGRWLFVGSYRTVERIGLAGAFDRSEVRLLGATQIVAGPDGQRLYGTRVRPAGVAAVRWGAAPVVDWTARLPQRPRVLALDPTGGVLVAGYGQRPGHLAFLDTATGSLQRTVTVASRPMALAISHDSGTVYALLRDGSLTAYTVTRGQQLASLRVGRHPRALAIAPDDSRVYVLDRSTKTLIVVDLATGMPSGTLRVPARPFDLALAPDGSRLLISSARAMTLWFIDPAGLEVADTQFFTQRPRQVVFGPARPADTTTPTPTRSRIHPHGPLPTGTPTAGPLPPGVIAGEIFDDASALPLGGALVRLLAPGDGTALSDADGHYVLPLAPLGTRPGGLLVALTKAGHTRALRRIVTVPGAAAVARDARLTQLAPPVTVGPAGGVVRTPYHARGGPVSVELRIPPAALAVDTGIRLTVLSPQGLVAPVPLGWSVLLGIDVQVPSTPEAPMTLRVPRALLPPAMSLPVTTASWDEGAHQWRGGPAVTMAGDALEIPLARAASGSSQLALLVADTVPVQPPAAVPGMPLQGVLPLQSLGEAAVVVTNPPAILSGTGGSAQVATQVQALSPLPSGTRLEARLSEQYALRDGQRITGRVSRQDLAGYQVSVGIPATTSDATVLGASFRLRPSRTFAISELLQGRVTIETLLPEAAESLHVVGPNGAEVTGAGGLRLTVPPGAVQQPTVIGLRPALRSQLPAGLDAGADFAGALELDVAGGALDPTGVYRFGLDRPATDGGQFVIGRIATGDAAALLVLAGFGHGEGGQVVLDPCPPGMTICQPGLSGSGTYVVLALPPDAAIVTGTVADGSEPSAGIAVHSDTTPVVSVTGPRGRYVLPAPAGVPSVFTARDAVRDLTATQSVVPAAGDVLSLDLLLLPTPPVVVQIDPPNHGGAVAPSASITITFSEPVTGESLGGSVRLEQLGLSGASVVSARVSLSADGTGLRLTPAAPLAVNTAYRVTLSGDITDAAGTALVPFTSDFTTAPLFTADELPANVLRVSLPDEQGRVFVCGGPELAAPGTFVTIINQRSATTFTGVATDRSGLSGSDACDHLFPGRCHTTQPGTFCAVIDANLGDHIDVQVQDVLHNTVTLDAGNMRDERTGATAVGSEGGQVVAVEDPRYMADVPPGAFDSVHMVTVFPVRDLDFPVRLQEGTALQRLGALFLDFGDDSVVAADEIDLTIPAPPECDPSRQVLVGHVIDFRGLPELTFVGTASHGLDNNGEAALSTDSPPFPGPRRAGFYDFSTPDRSVGYVIGVVDKRQSTIDILPTPITFVFPFVAPALTKFVMPVVADQPFRVTLAQTGGRPIDQIDIEGPPRGEFVELPRPLTDDETPANVEAFSLPDGSLDVPADVALVVTFSKPVAADRNGRLPAGAIQVHDASGVAIAGTWAVISTDGRRVRFFPQRPLPPAAVIVVRVSEVLDRNGNLFPVFSSSFSTFAPRLVASVPVPGNDVDVLERLQDGMPVPYALVAQDGDPTNDDRGGLAVLDVRNPRAPRLVTNITTDGIDRAVRVASSSPPLVLSVDGAGDPQRFGTLRAFDFTDPEAPVEVGRRVLNLSPQVISQRVLLPDISPEGGVPQSLAVLGSAIYVANPPVIGIQGVTLSRIIPPRNEIEGVFRGGYRTVGALRQFVVAAGQGRGSNELVTLDPTLSVVRDRRPLAAAPAALIALPAYPVDVDGDGNLGIAEDLDGDAVTAADEVADLVLVLCEGHILCVYSLSANGLIERETSLTLPAGLGNPRGGDVDPQARLLYLAAGTAGLAVTDFNDPFPTSLAERPLLATVPLQGQAKKVRLLRDARGIEYALVAGDQALDVVQVTPGTAGLTIYDTNNTAVIPERFEDSAGSFILANNDNDDASTDTSGRPILDRDDGARVDGEDDLRRLDITLPMGNGVVTLDMPAGAARARVWLTPDRDGLLALPQQYNLSAGERPPETAWIEGVAPSAADRDVRITLHWEPPVGSGLDPFDDAVAATVIELDFVAGRRGGAEPSSNLLGDRKTTFLPAEAEELQDILANEETLDGLGPSRFGALRIRGIGLSSVVQVTVRTQVETAMGQPRVVDETAPGDSHLEATGPRTLISDQDLAVYTGDVDVGGVTQTPAQVRAAFSPVLPIQAETAALGETAVLQALVIQSGMGLHPPLIGGAAGPAALEVIDAQAFAPQISDGVRGEALYDAYLGFDPSTAPHRAGMTGALSDRWSRLIVRLALPATDPHTAFDFHLGTQPASDEGLVGSHHIGDEAFPFGMLSLTGFEGFNADESFPERLTPDGPTLDLLDVAVRKMHRQRGAVATFTPPGSFPFKSVPNGAGLTQKLTLTIGPAGSAVPWATRPLLLVRPPVLFVHGLTGSRQAFGKRFVKTFLRNFIAVFADYATESVSGFDRIFKAVPREIEVELARLRSGVHPVDPAVPRRVEVGSPAELRKKKIAATRVDVVAHSMGGL
ncbi:MAG: Ig-like domain-containing protein, partial [Candidatus Binatia bacterium]